MAFSLIHSGHFLLREGHRYRYRDRQLLPPLWRQGGYGCCQRRNPRCRTGGIPTVSQTSARASGAAVYGGGFRCQKSFHGAGNGVAAGGENNDIVFDQLFDNSDMAVIVFGSGVVTANHTGNTTDTSVDDVVVEGVISAAEGSTQVILDGFHTKNLPPGWLCVWES